MTAVFDPVEYKAATRQQWEEAASAWHAWAPTLESWLGHATELMLDLADVTEGSRILDVMAGAGSQTVTAARRAGREQLDVNPESFDAVTSRLGLVYIPGQQQALTGMYRALRPGGRVAVIVYSSAVRNEFFSIPISIIRRRASLPPPLPGQPGPVSLGAADVLENAFIRAGFRDVTARVVPAPLRLPSVAEYVRFARESFGALHQMLAGLTAPERAQRWREIEGELVRFQDDDGFTGPCELIIAGVKHSLMGMADPIKLG